MAGIMSAPLIVVHAIHSGGFYGAERVVLDLVGIQREGTTVAPALLDLVDWNHPSSELGRRVSVLEARVRVLPARRGITLAALRAYADAMVALRADVVHSHGYKPTVLHVLSRMLRLHRVPLVVTAHGYVLTAPSLKERLYQTLDVFMLARADAVVAVSSAMEAYLASRSKRLRVTTIPNGIADAKEVSGNHPLPEFLRQTVAKMDPRRGRPIVIGSLGRLVPMKNHALLIDVVGEMMRDGVHCLPVVLGDGPLREELEERWRSAIPDIEPLLVSHQEDVLAWLADMDIFCMPSGPGEGLPMALLEAGLLARPVVCSDSGGMAELIDDGGNGFLIRMGDAEALRDRLLKLVVDESARARLGSALRTTVTTRHSIGAVSERYAELYALVAL
ncbi:glycosyltransferase [soil metagenome]